MEAQHNILKLWGVSWSVNNKTSKYIVFLDGQIFAVHFETTSHCLCLLSLLVWLRKKQTLHSSIFNKIFLSCRVPTFRGQKVVKHGGHQGISFLFIDWTTICISMAASLWLKSCEDHSLLKSYNGGLWKNNYRSGPIIRDLWGVTVLCREQDTLYAA